MFVGGKGGVGKTTCAAALAVRGAASRRTLLVSTDPASSLSDVLRTTVGPTPRRVRGIAGLHAADVEPAAAFAAWLEPRQALLATVAVRGTYLDEEDVSRLLKLTLPGIDEVAGLLEIVRLGAAFDQVVVDTAPTGHTLRLLGMPAVYSRVAQLLDGVYAHHRQVVSALRGRYDEDAADSFIQGLDREAEGLAALLRDRARSAFAWVTLPEPMALEETRDAVAALRQTGIAIDTLIVNRTAPIGGACGWDAARRRFEARALAPIARRFPGAQIRLVPELDDEPRGAGRLADVSKACTRPAPAVRPAALQTRVYGAFSSGRTPATADGLLADGMRWLLFGGKGGVGKSTCAAAAAVRIAAAQPDRRFLLLSSDPAHSLGDVFGARIGDAEVRPPGAPPNLRVRELDAAAAFAVFRQQYMDAVEGAFGQLARATSAGSDAAAFRRLIDIAPPGIDEAMAIADISALLDEGDAVVILDTAPTGHVLRLLATPEILAGWSRALMAILLKYEKVVSAGDLGRLLVQLSQRLRALQARLRDPAQAAFVVVTRAAELPGAETGRLLQALEQFGIAVGAVIVNALGAGSCPRCLRVRERQRRAVAAMRPPGTRPRPYAIIGTPATLPPPHGAAALAAWASRWCLLD